MQSIESLIRRRHEDGQGGQWVVIDELPNGTGGHKTRAIDVAALNCWPSSGYYRVAYEVKRSRGDFIRELEDPAKHKWVEENFHETYFAFSSADIGKPEEIPEGWGLVVQSKKGDTLRTTVRPRRREIGVMKETLHYSIIRRTVDQMQQLRNRTYSVDKTEFMPEEFAALVTKKVNEQCEYARKNLEKGRQEYLKMTDSLITAERKYTKPLRELMQLANGSDYSLAWTKEEDMTADWVRNMVDQAVKRKVDSLMQHIKNAGWAINELLEVIGSATTKEA